MGVEAEAGQYVCFVYFFFPNSCRCLMVVKTHTKSQTIKKKKKENIDTRIVMREFLLVVSFLSFFRD